MSNLDTLPRPEPELSALETHIESDIGVLGSGSIAAFAIARERVAVAVEVPDDLRTLLAPDALAEAAREAAAQRGANARSIVLVNAGSLPRTPDGALDRDALRRLW